VPSADHHPARDLDLAAAVVAVGRAAGLDVVGVAVADPFPEARLALEGRKAEGLHGGMQFTYRNPTRSTDPSAALAGARSLVVGAVAYPAALPARPGDDVVVGRVARYATDDHYGRLRAALAAVADHLAAEGWATRVLVDDNALVDRAAAHRAGLGWWGRSSLILVPGHGPWVVLGSVVTDAPLAGDVEPVADGCGSCTRCVDACPTGAIVAPGVVDARRCLAWLVQDVGSFPRHLRPALGDRLYGCDECLEVCPPGRRATLPGATEVTTDAWVDVVAMLALDDDALMARHGRWYIPRREPRYLRRNALVVLGNAGAVPPAEVRPVLAAHLRHPDGMVRSHAAWAARRLGHVDLLAVLVGDDDPEVRAELAAAPP
jgi:epoxyqueuosine reductase